MREEGYINCASMFYIMHCECKIFYNHSNVIYSKSVEFHIDYFKSCT